ncbi:hypothetical protein CsatA_014628 [Cannabis sativa]
MAPRKISDFERAMKLNQTPSQNESKVSNPDEISKTKKKKKEFKPIICDVNPPKKKLVKTMAFEYIAYKLISSFHGEKNPEPEKFKIN